jgi:hypothetical protein
MTIPTVARATDEILGPDESVVTKDTYPTELMLRPIVIPQGLVVLDLSPGYQSFCCSSATSPAQNAATVVLDAAYGLGWGFELGAEAMVYGKYGGELYAHYQFMENIGVSLTASYAFDETHPVFTDLGGLELGVPVKLKVPNIPISFNALDTLFGTYEEGWPSEDNTPAVDRDLTRSYSDIELPASLQISPAQLFSFEVGGAALLKTFDTLPSRSVKGEAYSSWKGTFVAWGGAFITTRHVDVGVLAGHDFYIENNSPGLTYVTLRVEVRLW